MRVRLLEEYEVGEGAVSLSVVVGEGQRGHTSVRHEGRELAHGPSIEDLPIGNGEGVRGTEVRVSTTVTDTNPETNLTSVTYTLKGGQEEKTFRLQREVGESETIRYYSKFTLL